MIIQTLVDFAVSILVGAIHGIEFLSLPLDLIEVLGSICAYGSWVVGSDILLIFAGNVAIWTGIKIAYGIIVYIWKLLPLT